MVRVAGDMHSVEGPEEEVATAFATEISKYFPEISFADRKKFVTQMRYRSSGDRRRESVSWRTMINEVKQSDDLLSFTMILQKPNSQGPFLMGNN